MVEKILGKEVAEDIFYSAMLTGMMTEKQAEELDAGMEKEAAWPALVKALGVLKGLGHTAIGTTEKGVGALSKIPGIGMKLALIGAGTGVLGATAYDIIKENVTNEDPKAELDAKLEAMYRGKQRELEDAKWMTKVRNMRDDLKRNYRKMSTKEYTEKYNALISALDERMA